MEALCFGRWCSTWPSQSHPHVLTRVVMLGKTQCQKFKLFFLHILTLKFSVHILLQSRSCITYPASHLPPQMCSKLEASGFRIFNVNLDFEYIFILILTNSYYLFLCQLAGGMSHSLLCFSKEAGRDLLELSVGLGNLKCNAVCTGIQLCCCQGRVIPLQWATGGCQQTGMVVLLAG